MGDSENPIIQSWVAEAQDMELKTAVLKSTGVTDYVMIRFASGNVRLLNCLTCFHHFPVAGDAVRLPMKGWILRKTKQSYEVKFVGVVHKLPFGIEYVVMPRGYGKLPMADTLFRSMRQPF